MDSKTKKILFFMSEINELYEKIKSKFNEHTVRNIDRAFFWEDSLADIKKISRLINRLLDKAGADLAHYRRNYEGTIHFFSASPRNQEQIIKDFGFNEWFTKLMLIMEKMPMMENLPEAVMNNYLYLHENYDAFSEHSRDNNGKANFIFSLAKPNFRLLEIGPGTGALLRRLLEKELNVNAIEVEEKMISIILNKCSKAKGKVRKGNFFDVNLDAQTYDLILNVLAV